MTLFFVAGIPQAQGSMKHIGGGRIVHQNSKELMAWREAIAWSAKAAGCRVSDLPFVVTLDFTIPKPKSVKREYPTVPKDIDKLARSCLDSMTGFVWKDDAQVIDLHAIKKYGDTPGVLISVNALQP